MVSARPVFRLALACALVAGCGLLALWALSSSPDPYATLLDRFARPPFALGRPDGPSSTPEASGQLALYDGSAGCDVCPPSDTVCWTIGEQNLARSLVAPGSGGRVRAFLRKLTSGQPVTVAVLGSSVSSGVGLASDDNASSSLEKPVFGRLLFEQLTRLYPHDDHVFWNGAAAGKDSDYFSACFPDHLPARADLILTEYGVNDDLSIRDAQGSHEDVLRGLLTLPYAPAVINVQAVDLTAEHMFRGGDVALAVSALYDVPTISLSMVLLPQFIRDPASRNAYFGAAAVAAVAAEAPGGQHARPFSHNLHGSPRAGPSGGKAAPAGDLLNANGHALLANLIRIHLQREICRLAHEPAAPRAGSKKPSGALDVALVNLFPAIPDIAFTGRYSDEKVVPVDWTCLSSSAEPSLLVPTAADDWASAVDPTSGERVLRATTAGATFTLSTGPLVDGTIRLGVVSSVTLPSGDVRCTLRRPDDGAEWGAWKLSGAHTVQAKTVTLTDDLWSNVGPGSYDVSCTLTPAFDSADDLDFAISYAAFS